MDSSSEMIALPRPPSKKWVTFDDLIEHDDAMESGKRRTTKSDGKDETFFSNESNIFT